MEYKRSRDELVPGDKVVYIFPGYLGSPNAAYEVEVVRATKTRIIVVHPEKHREEAFLKSSGESIGSSDSYLSTRIEVGKWAEHALTKGRENMKRQEISALLNKIDQVIKNPKVPLAMATPLIEDALRVVKE